MWSRLQSWCLDFLSLSLSPSLLHWREANKGLSHWSIPGSLSREILAKPFHLWVETKSGNPYRSTLSPVWFIIYLTFLNNTSAEIFLQLVLCLSRAEIHSHVTLDVNKSWGKQLPAWKLNRIVTWIYSVWIFIGGEWMLFCKYRLWQLDLREDAPSTTSSVSYVESLSVTVMLNSSIAQISGCRFLEERKFFEWLKCEKTR